MIVKFQRENADGGCKYVDAYEVDIMDWKRIRQNDLDSAVILLPAVKDDRPCHATAPKEERCSCSGPDLCEDCPPPYIQGRGVYIRDKSGHTVRQYFTDSAIFIMNDQGQTVDKHWPEPVED